MILRQDKRRRNWNVGGWLAVALLLSAFGFCESDGAQSASPSLAVAEGELLAQSASAAPTTPASPDAQSTGRISGTIAVQNGALATGATVTLTRDGQPPVEVLSGDNGEFSFS